MGLYCNPSDDIKVLGIEIDSKLPFHAHEDYIFSQSVSMLGLISTIIYSFFSLSIVY